MHGRGGLIKLYTRNNVFVNLGQFFLFVWNRDETSKFVMNKWSVLTKWKTNFFFTFTSFFITVLKFGYLFNPFFLTLPFELLLENIKNFDISRGVKKR